VTDSFAENVTTSVSTRFDLRRVQGRQVMHILDMKVDFDIQGMTVQFDNLFGGNKVLGECGLQRLQNTVWPADRRWL
jgi:hypothetical protein